MKKQVFFLALVLISFLQIVKAQVITTLAGGSGHGFADGTGSSAKFNHPNGITTDSYGNVYVADVNNYRIRLITPTGVVTTFAGSSTSSNTPDGVSPDGWGSNARFFQPTSICKDADGNMYVSDNDNKIRKVTLSQNVTTNSSCSCSINGISLNSGNFYFIEGAGIKVLASGGNFGYILAGGGFYGNVDGTGTSARFQSLWGICQDASGNSYVTDAGNHNIRKVTPSGVVTTFAGSTIGYVDAIGISAKFNTPQGICIDPSGNLYVADSVNHIIRKITPNGIVTTIVALTGSYSPNGICIDTVGNLYVTCSNNADSKIIKITLNLDIDDNVFINNLKVYPNPAKDHITIDCGTLTNVVGYSIKITNTLGQEVFNQPMNTQQYYIPLNSWGGQGMYFVNVINAQGNTIDVRKIILQ